MHVHITLRKACQQSTCNEECTRIYMYIVCMYECACFSLQLSSLRKRRRRKGRSLVITRCCKSGSSMEITPHVVSPEPLILDTLKRGHLSKQDTLTSKTHCLYKPRHFTLQSRHFILSKCEKAHLCVCFQQKHHVASL